MLYTYEVLVFLRGTIASHSINNTKIKGTNPASDTRRVRMMEYALYSLGTGISEGHSGKPIN